MNEETKKKPGALKKVFGFFKFICTLVGAIVILGFAGIQAIPVESVVPGGYSNPEVVNDMDAPEDVEAILRKACYDCHSHEVKWPWYSHIAPVSYLVAHDVKEGREVFNFSEWPEDPDDAESARWSVADVIETGEMPLEIYLKMHPEAVLTDDEKAKIQAWAYPDE